MDKLSFYLNQYIMLLANSFLGGVVLYMAFNHENDGGIVEYWMQATAIFTVTFGLTGHRLTKSFVRSLGYERLVVNILGLAIMLVPFTLFKIFYYG